MMDSGDALDDLLDAALGSWLDRQAMAEERLTAFAFDEGQRDIVVPPSTSRAELRRWILHFLSDRRSRRAPNARRSGPGDGGSRRRGRPRLPSGRSRRGRRPDRCARRDRAGGPRSRGRSGPTDRPRSGRPRRAPRDGSGGGTDAGREARHELRVLPAGRLADGHPRPPLGRSRGGGPDLPRRGQGEPPVRPRLSVLRRGPGAGRQSARPRGGLPGRVPPRDRARRVRPAALPSPGVPREKVGLPPIPDERHEGGAP